MINHEYPRLYRLLIMFLENVQFPPFLGTIDISLPRAIIKKIAMVLYTYKFIPDMYKSNQNVSILSHIESYILVTKNVLE